MCTYVITLKVIKQMANPLKQIPLSIQIKCHSHLKIPKMLYVYVYLLPSGSEQHKVLLFGNFWEGILQARH